MGNQCKPAIQVGWSLNTQAEMVFLFSAPRTVCCYLFAKFMGKLDSVDTWRRKHSPVYSASWLTE